MPMIGTGTRQDGDEESFKSFSRPVCHTACRRLRKIAPAPAKNLCHAFQPVEKLSHTPAVKTRRLNTGQGVRMPGAGTTAPATRGYTFTTEIRRADRPMAANVRSKSVASSGEGTNGAIGRNRRSTSRQPAIASK